MAVTPLLAGMEILKAVEQQLSTVVSASILGGRSRAAHALNENMQAVQRRWNYVFQRQSARPGPNYEPTVLDVSSILRQHHQQPWGPNGGIAGDGWNWTYHRLGAHGIDVAAPGDVNPSGYASDWTRLIQMAATAAPLDGAIYRWHRLRGDGGAALDAARAELDFHLRRGGYSRYQDRDLITAPWWQWTPQDAQRLLWLGVANVTDWIGMMRGAGASRAEDQAWWDYLQLQMPDPTTLAQWAARRLWSDEIADRYGLDSRYNDSPIATFFSRRQGWQEPPINLPDQPAGNVNWLKLSMRDAATLPSFGEVRTMQHRLRPDGQGGGMSVIAGVPDWGEANTRHMLQAAGYTEPIIERLMGLVPEPLNIRIINNVLLETLKHPQIAADAQAASGEGVDWVMGAYLDHGFSRPTAKMAADAIRARADDEYHAERDEAIKSQRRAARELTLKSYSAGLMTDEEAGLAIINEQFTQAMAHEAIEQVNKEFHLALVESQIKAIREAVFSGKISLPQASAQLSTAGIVDARRILYLQQWAWERTESLRMLSTGEIITALKQGLMTASQAVLRLSNLGWSGADALIEVGIAQSELASSAAKAEAAQARRQESEQRAQEKAQQAQAAKLAAEKARAAKEAHKEALNEATAIHRKLSDQAKYLEKLHRDQAALDTAQGKGETEKVIADFQAQLAAYQDWIIAQQELAGQSPAVADETLPIETEPAPEAPESPTAPAAGPASPGPTGTPPATSGGSGQPPTP